VTQCQPDQQIHIILDNLSAHKTKLVTWFLAAHPNVQLHFTPTYSSWLNQVEIWFARIERDVIARGIFTSVSDLARKLRSTFRLIQLTPSRFSGSIPIPLITSVMFSLRQATGGLSQLKRKHKRFSKLSRAREQAFFAC
jgi:transposase